MLPGLVVIPGGGVAFKRWRVIRRRRFVYRLTVSGSFLAFAPQNEADACRRVGQRFGMNRIILRGNRPKTSLPIYCAMSSKPSLMPATIRPIQIQTDTRCPVCPQPW